MSDEFYNFFQHDSDTQANDSVPLQESEEKKIETAHQEEIEEYDGPLLPRLNPFQIVLVLAIVVSLAGFGIFYVNRTSAQNNSSSASLTPIPTQTDASLSIPTQSADDSTPATATQPTTPQTEGGQPDVATSTPTPTVVPTATPTPTSSPAPTATNTPTPTPTVTPTDTPTGTPTDTPTASPTP